jgi:MATE family multidrug resistance protein
MPQGHRAVGRSEVRKAMSSNTIEPTAHPVDVPLEEPRWAGVQEVMRMAGPIVLGSLSYTLMEFTDKAMVAQLGTDALAASGSAGIWSYTTTTFLLGVTGCVSTFASQSFGREKWSDCARYTWQGVWMSLLAIGLIIVLWPSARYLFTAMQHEPEVVRLETLYFQTRLFGYVGMAWGMAMACFFQSINRPGIPMYTAIASNALNILLNYLLIFGKFGFPELGIVGAGIATSIAQTINAIVLHIVFLRPSFNDRYQTRSTWALDLKRIGELWRVGWPSGVHMLLDILNWAIFTGFVVGYFGGIALAAQTATLSFMFVSFMPAIAINQAIAPIVGQWLGRQDVARAKARAYTAVKLCTAYMLTMGIIFAVFGKELIALVFSDDPEVIALGAKLLILAAIFQGFDGLNIVLAGALRGAGDTRWMMWMTFFAAYLIFLPLSLVVAFLFNGGTIGAWIAATIFIILLGGVMLRRWQGEKWRSVSIFTNES